MCVSHQLSVSSVSRADVCEVDEVGGFSNHTAINPPPPLPLLHTHTHTGSEAFIFEGSTSCHVTHRWRVGHHTAANPVPEVTHAVAPTEATSCRLEEETKNTGASRRSRGVVVWRDLRERERGGVRFFRWLHEEQGREGKKTKEKGEQQEKKFQSQQQ